MIYHAIYGTTALFTMWAIHWIYRWTYPRCNGRLPPGSMGLPILGETLQYFTPFNSWGISPFIKQRMERYGPVFKTNLVGVPIVVATDAEFNRFIFLEEGRTFESWYPETFTEILGLDIMSLMNGFMYKYLKSLILKLFGPENLKENLLHEADKAACSSLLSWSSKPSIELKEATSEMIFNLTAKKLISYDPSASSEKFRDNFVAFLNGLISFPLNIPGTAYYECLQDEHEGIIKKRENPNSGITWDEYKSMSSTFQVISESIRLANIVPGIFRKVLKDAKINGYTILAGWRVMVCPPAVHLNPEIYKHPLSFNPWRWKTLVTQAGANKAGS